MPGIVGRKVGMSQMFLDDGKVVPVTFVFCQNNKIYQVKDEKKDNCSSLVLGAEELKNPRKTKKFRILRQFPIPENSELKKGNELSVNIFEIGEKVSVVSKSKGRGFAGNVRRHNFKTARHTHGTKEHRHGSTNNCSITSRIRKGLKMPGRMGNKQVTIKNVEVIFVDQEQKVLGLKGPIPGSKKSIVVLRKI